LLGVYGGPPCLVTYPNGDRTIYVMTVFECAVIGGTLLGSSDETSDARFVAAHELPSYPTSAWVRHVLPGLYDRSRTVHFEPPRWQVPGAPRPSPRGPSAADHPTSNPSGFRPDGWHTVTPRIVACDAPGLVEFVKHVFGATGDCRADAPAILRIGDSNV